MSKRIPTLIWAIDPGPVQSAWVLFCADDERPVGWGIEPNDELLANLRCEGGDERDLLVVEEIASYGMPVGVEVFDTVFWTGRLIQGWADRFGPEAQWQRVRRSTVKMHLCHTMKATDATIRQALIDRYGPGKDKAIGKKAAPGPLYSIHSDLWQALALAVTVSDQLKSADVLAVTQEGA
jgi:hypothetical protein